MADPDPAPADDMTQPGPSPAVTPPASEPDDEPLTEPGPSPKTTPPGDDEAPATSPEESDDNGDDQ